MINKTKIVCTIGPSSWDPQVIKEMIHNGMNCARVNGAFADKNEIDKVTHLVRSISDKVALMMDVKGPEVRLNKFPSPIPLTPGQKIIIGNDAGSEIYPANYKDLYKVLSVGQRMVVGDGDVELILEQIEGDKMVTSVVFGEVLKPGKALNLPGANYTSKVLTEKDIENLQYSIKLNWDFVSASFIQNSQSAKQIKKYIESSDMKLIAKIEDEEGVKNIDEILDEVDGIIVARGGLGVELGLEKVPIVQRNLIKKANEAGKIVVTATQMLESMITNPRPTRAEANDVATAILLGTDAVMLSGESSVGNYPAKAVEFLSIIAQETEKCITPLIINKRTNGPVASDALAKAVAQLAIEYGDEIKCILVVSKSGRTARLIARHSVSQPIHTFVKKASSTRQLSISKGITTADVIEKICTDREQAIESVLDQAKKLGYISRGDKILFVSKIPFDKEQFFPNIFEVLTV